MNDFSADWPLSQLDAFFVAYQETAGISMQLGVTIEITGPIEAADIERGLAAVCARWPRLGQTLRRRIFGLAWSGPVDTDNMLSIGTHPEEIDAWRNRSLDPFVEPPFQVLWLGVGEESTLALRAHHAVADGESLMAIGALFLRALAGEAGPWPAEPPVALFSKADALRPRRLGRMVRYARWLVSESKAGTAARLVQRRVEPGDLGVVSRRLPASALSARATSAGVSQAILTSAAWAQAIHRFNQERHGDANARISLEVPVSVRRRRHRGGAVGNFISPLVLIVDAESGLEDIARDLRRQLRAGIRDRAFLAMPVLTAPGRYLPWPLFRRMSSGTTWSGFATSHFTWLDVDTTLPTAVADASDGRLRLEGQRVHTPVCLHMGAALSAVASPGGVDLFVTHRLAGVTKDDAGDLLERVALAITA